MFCTFQIHLTLSVGCLRSHDEINVLFYSGILGWILVDIGNQASRSYLFWGEEHFFHIFPSITYIQAKLIIITLEEKYYSATKKIFQCLRFNTEDDNNESFNVLSDTILNSYDMQYLPNNVAFHYKECIIFLVVTMSLGQS